MLLFLFFPSAFFHFLLTLAFRQAANFSLSLSLFPLIYFLLSTPPSLCIHSFLYSLFTPRESVTSEGTRCYLSSLFKLVDAWFFLSMISYLGCLTKYPGYFLIYPVVPVHSRHCFMYNDEAVSLRHISKLQSIFKY